MYTRRSVVDTISHVRSIHSTSTNMRNRTLNVIRRNVEATNSCNKHMHEQQYKNQRLFSNIVRQTNFFQLSTINRGVITFKLADIGEGIAEVEILKWQVNEGDVISEMDNICEVQSDKSAVEISSPYSGRIVKFYNKVGEMVKIGTPLMDIEVEEENSTAEVKNVKTADSSFSPKPESKEVNKPQQIQGTIVLASPACRYYARQYKIDLSNVTPTGPNNRVTKEDVLKYIENKKNIADTTNVPTKPPSTRLAEQDVPKVITPSPPASKLSGEVKEEILLQSGIAKGMIKSMNASLLIPSMSLQEDIDLTDIMREKDKINKILAKKKPPSKTTITSFIIKCVSEALKSEPILNSKFNIETQDRYTLYRNHNISIAIDTPHGLLVPNMKNVESMGLDEIQQNLNYLQYLAVNNKLTPEHFKGGTISISNVGVIGSTAVRPILFDGQAAILGLGRLQKLPRYSEETNVLEPRSIMNITATVDHRHVDGATVARFIKQLRMIIENPSLMLL